jgi:hypothetical protein
MIFTKFNKQKSKTFRLFGQKLFEIAGFVILGETVQKINYTKISRTTGTKICKNIK